jgi:hypothetical protein
VGQASRWIPNQVIARHRATPFCGAGADGSTECWTPLGGDLSQPGHGGVRRRHVFLTGERTHEPCLNAADVAPGTHGSLTSVAGDSG